MIAVDWGTTSLRCYRLDEGGNVIAQRRSEDGVLACQGRFATTLATQLEGWDDAVVLMSGMVGSRNGWHEVPYLPCPAGVPALAGALTRFADPALPGRQLWIAAGVVDPGDSVPDVMRGEETQICGLLAGMPTGMHVICLPGTHSKWVTVQNGAIRSVATSMTGEVYALLKDHSLLGKLMAAEPARFDAFAFDGGLRRSSEEGGLLHQLFGVRTLALFDQLPATALASYLSGLLIGHEIHASGLFQRVPRPAQVHLIGNERLVGNYARALTALGVGIQRHSEHVAAHGLYQLAKGAGLA